jgi:hypothetical protein
MALDNSSRSATCCRTGKIGLDARRDAVRGYLTEPPFDRRHHRNQKIWARMDELTVVYLIKLILSAHYICRRLSYAAASSPVSYRFAAVLLGARLRAPARFVRPVSRFRSSRRCWRLSRAGRSTTRGGPSQPWLKRLSSLAEINPTYKQQLTSSSRAGTRPAS